MVERDRYYDRVPPTANAEVDELNVEPAGPRTPGAYPNVLDDTAQPDAVRLDLEELLAFAIGNSPDYRAEKEELYLAALSLIIERHLWGPRFFAAVTGRLTGSPESNDTPAAASVIGSLGVTQRLPYGGTVSATALADYVTFLREEADDGDETTRIGRRPRLAGPAAGCGAQGSTARRTTSGSRPSETCCTPCGSLSGSAGRFWSTSPRNTSTSSAASGRSPTASGSCAASTA